MPIPTEMVGSLPRPMKLQEDYEDYDEGKISWEDLQALQDEAAEDSIKRLEEVGAPVVTDGEQRESSFATYPLTHTLAGTGLAENLGPEGQFFAIFDDDHHRQLPVLTGGPFKYQTYAAEFVEKNKKIASGPVKQAVISPSMMMLLYPVDEEIEGYSREQFLDDLVDECEKDIRKCFEAGAVRVSIDFTEGRLANKNDSRNPWTGKDMLGEFIELNNRAFDRFSAEERKNIGIHTCPGGDCDSVHSAEVPYEKLLNHMFEMNAGYFLIQCASEQDKEKVYKLWAREQPRRPGLLHGGDRPAQPRGRDSRAGQGRPGGRRPAHPAGAPRGDRRLRLLAVQPRRQAQARLAGLRARRGDEEDRLAPGGRPDGLRGAGDLADGEPSLWPWGPRRWTRTRPRHRSGGAGLGSWVAGRSFGLRIGTRLR